jgi:two-component system chemotaxis response regulator CheB
MEPFPPDLQPPDGEHRTSLICPDCGGSVTVRAEGRGLLLFECRVGHLYTTEEMVIGKENHIEHVMWAAIHAYEEMAAFLRTLDQRAAETAVPQSERARRIEQATQNARVLRAVIENDRRVSLPVPVNGETATP